MPRVRGETAAARAVVGLMDEVGPTKTARELGVSTTLLYKARNSGQVTKPIELAAAAILERLRAGLGAPRVEAPPLAPAEPTPPEQRKLVLLELPEQHMAALRRIAQILHADIAEA